MSAETHSTMKEVTTAFYTTAQSSSSQHMTQQFDIAIQTPSNCSNASCISNHTASSPTAEFNPYPVVSVLVPLIFGLILFIGFVANIGVMVVNISTFNQANRGSRISKIFITNLAIADMLFLIFCVPFQATIYSMDGWPFGGFMCVFSEVCQQVAMLASIYTLVALSFDR